MRCLESRCDDRRLALPQAPTRLHCHLTTTVAFSIQCVGQASATFTFVLTGGLRERSLQWGQETLGLQEEASSHDHP